MFADVTVTNETLIFVTVVAIPIFLGALVTLAASGSGAEAKVRLPRDRYVLATATGTVVGWLFLAGAVRLSMLVAPHVGAMFVVILLGSLWAGLAGYQTAKLLSGRLNWYTCPRCQLKFRSREAVTRCRICELEGDQNTVAESLAKPSRQIQDL